MILVVRMTEGDLRQKNCDTRANHARFTHPLIDWPVNAWPLIDWKGIVVAEADRTWESEIHRIRLCKLGNFSGYLAVRLQAAANP